MVRNIEVGIRFRVIITGTVGALIATVLLSVVSGLVVHYTPLNEGYTPTLSMVVILLSVFWGASNAAKSAGSSGLLHGLAVGVLFWLATSLISVLIFSTALSNTAVLKKLILSLVGGALGGVYGVSRGK